LTVYVTLRQLDVQEPYAALRKIRCHYSSAEAFLEALVAPGRSHSIQVFTTDAFEPGEELLLEVYFPGLPGKMMVRAIGQEWHSARPRLRIRAGGVLRCTGSEWRKLEFLKTIAEGKLNITARRRHVRLPVMVEVKWRRSSDSDFTLAAMCEISEGGALLLTDAELEVEEEVIIQITPPGSERPLEVLAVARSPGNPEGVGVEFLARDMGGVHRLREVIRRLVEQ
jgi:hypothetical protein